MWHGSLERAEMEKLRQIISLAYFVALVVLTLILVGCGSTTRIIEREVKIPYQVEVKDTIVLKDTVSFNEPYWYGEVSDSLNNIIGNLKVYYKKKLAAISISKIDTVKRIDTIYVEQPFKDFLKESAGDFSMIEKLILYGMAGLVTVLIFIIRKKKK